MSIPTEAIEAAARSMADFDGSDWAALSDDDKDLYQIIATAALTAAAPYIQAAALREAADGFRHCTDWEYRATRPMATEDYLRARAELIEGTAK